LELESNATRLVHCDEKKNITTLSFNAGQQMDYTL
jgi:hypothetical protein